MYPREMLALNARVPC